MPLQAEDFIASIFRESEDRAYSTLIHEYDPMKRREYYLKTRQLKGRQPGLVNESVGHLVRSGAVAPTKPKHHKKALSHKQVMANLEALKSRLEHLREVLRELVKAANRRSGVKTKTTETHKKREPSKLTPKERVAAKKRSKAYYDKHKGTPQAQVKEIQAKIKEIQAKIAQLRAKLESSNQKPAKKDELKSAVSSTTKR